MVSGTALLDENPQKFPFLNPNPLVDGMIAQNSRKNYFVSEFWAYQNLSGQIPTFLGSLRTPGEHPRQWQSKVVRYY
jgi:hypothetical protein